MIHVTVNEVTGVGHIRVGWREVSIIDIRLKMKFERQELKKKKIEFHLSVFCNIATCNKKGKQKII